MTSSVELKKIDDTKAIILYFDKIQNDQREAFLMITYVRIFIKIFGT